MDNLIIIFGIKCNILSLNLLLLTQHLLVACRAERMPRIVQMSPSSSDPDSVAVAAESHDPPFPFHHLHILVKLKLENTDSDAILFFFVIGAYFQ